MKLETDISFFEDCVLPMGLIKIFKGKSKTIESKSTASTTTDWKAQGAVNSNIFYKQPGTSIKIQNETSVESKEDNKLIDIDANGKIGL